MTFGTSVQFDDDPEFLEGWNFAQEPNSNMSVVTSVALTDSLVVFGYIDTSDHGGYVKAATISGDVPTIGAVQTFSTGGAPGPWPTHFGIERISDSTFIIVWKLDNVGGGATIWDGMAIMGSVSGTTITLGSPFVWMDWSVLGIDTEWNAIYVTALSSTKALIGLVPEIRPSVADTAGYYLCVIEFTGTTISGAGTVTLLQTGSVFAHISLDALSATAACVLEGRLSTSFSGGIDYYTVIASISGTTVTLNTAELLFLATNGGHTPTGSIVALSASTLLCVYTKSEYVDWPPSGLVQTEILTAAYADVVGTTISVWTPEELIVVDPFNNEILGLNAVFISSTKIAIGYNFSDLTQFGEIRISIIDVAITTPVLSSTLTYTAQSAPVAASPVDEVVLAVLGSGRFVLQFIDEDTAIGYLVVYSSAFVNKVLGMSIGKGDGNRLYATCWSPSLQELILKVYDLPALTLSAEYSLGSATEAEVDSRTWWAHPFCLVGNDDYVIIYGRMDNPAGLGSPVHMTVSLDAGVTQIRMEDGFGDDHIGAVIEDQLGFIGAIRNINGSEPKLYSGIPGGSLSLLSTVPVAAGVNPKAFAIDFNGNVLVGRDAGASVMILYSPPPFVKWYDFTFNHGTLRGINSVIVL